MMQQRPKLRRPDLPRTRKLRAHTSTADDLGYDPEPHMKLSRALFIVVLIHVVAVGGLFAFQSLKEKGSRSQREEAAASAAYPRSYVTSGVNTDAGLTRTHYVEKGETLSKIAAERQVPIDELMRVNQIRDPSLIQAGQALIIPAPLLNTPAPLDMGELAAITKAQSVRTEAPVKPPALANEVVELRSLPPKNPSVERETLVSPSEIALRQKFREAKAEVTGSATIESRTPPSSKAKTYVVEKGDNPVLIAKRYGVSYNELLRINKISDPKKLKVGQKLVIP